MFLSTPEILIAALYGKIKKLRNRNFQASQVSVEYLMIIGFVVIITIPLIILYYRYTSDSSDEIITSQINQIARKIADAAESVYFLGSPSQTTFKVYIPGQIDGASLDNREILFNVSTKSGVSEIVQISSVNLTGSLPINQSTYSITLKASSTGVEISYK